MSDDQAPLFQDSDEFEQTYAPEQAPSEDAATDEPPPLIPVRGDTSQNQPIPLPPHDPAKEIPDADDRQRTD